MAPDCRVAPAAPAAAAAAAAAAAIDLRLPQRQARDDGEDRTGGHRTPRGSIGCSRFASPPADELIHTSLSFGLDGRSGTGGHEPPEPAPNAGKVGARSEASEDAGQPLGAHGGMEGTAVAFDPRQDEERSPGAHDAPEKVPAAMQGRAEERPAVEVKEIEGEEERWSERPTGKTTRQGCFIEPAEAVDDDELAVEHGRARLDLIGERREIGEASLSVDAVAADDAEERRAGCRTGCSSGDGDEDPEPTPERLEDVIRGVEGDRQEARLHRSQSGREGRELGRELEGELVGHGGDDGRPAAPILARSVPLPPCIARPAGVSGRGPSRSRYSNWSSVALPSPSRWGPRPPLLGGFDDEPFGSQ